MTAIVIDNNKTDTDHLTYLLCHFNLKITVNEVFTSLNECKAFLLNNISRPDIIFMDIEFEDGNSFELFDTPDFKSKVIITTRLTEYAYHAYRNNVTDYLLKPILKEHLITSFEKVKTILNGSSINGANKYKRQIQTKLGSRLINIKAEDIAYIYHNNKLSYFYLFDGRKVPSFYNLKEIEDMLDPDLYFRANRQFIIHLKAIHNVERQPSSKIILKLTPAINKEIVLSKERSKYFRKWMDQ